ncbi:MAG: DUF309 domain-containing protein [Candidatus Thermoplasmatota archaeon]|nr:DUF309 domain-containing protein [Candidatus Thermoplasmatota archaeon]
MRLICGIPSANTKALQCLRSSFISRRTTYGTEADFFNGATDSDLKTLSTISLFRAYPELERENLNRENFSSQLLSFLEMERFWEAHEIMEVPWKKCKDKSPIHGFIRILVSQVKWQMRQEELYDGILEEGMAEIRKSMKLGVADIVSVKEYPVKFRERFLKEIIRIAEANI